jgi:pimeloyl-ACP methyl ester carboxylesterase
MRRLITHLAALALVLAACGGGTATTTAAPDRNEGSATTSPTTTEAATETSAASTTTTTASSGDTTDTAPPPDTSPPDTGSAEVQPEPVQFVSGDEFLEATVWRSGSTWVVLGHMFPADRSSWNLIATELSAAGYSVLAYDNRGYGGSTGTKEPFALVDDARAAIEFARTGGAGVIVYGGASMNGATAMIVGATEDVGAVFMLSAVGSFPSVEDAESYLPQIAVPIYFFAAYDDGTAADDVSMTFTALAPTAQATYFQVGGHGTDMYPTNPGLMLDLLAFLEQSVS